MVHTERKSTLLYSKPECSKRIAIIPMPKWISIYSIFKHRLASYCGAGSLPARLQWVSASALV